MSEQAIVLICLAFAGVLMLWIVAWYFLRCDQIALDAIRALKHKDGQP